MDPLEGLGIRCFSIIGIHKRIIILTTTPVKIVSISGYLAVYVDPRPTLGNSHITRSEPRRLSRRGLVNPDDETIAAEASLSQHVSYSLKSLKGVI